MKMTGHFTRWAFIVVSLMLGACSATAPSRSIVIQGGTLIDGTGRAAIADSVVVIRDGKFAAVGKRGDVAIPQDAELIDAKGKTLLPGLIDGHCHYRDWMGELYLAYGVVTCPNISNNPVEWITAQREGVKNGSVRGPRVWASANIIDGPPPGGTGVLRRQRTSIIVDSEEEARKAVRDLVAQGVDGIKLFERLKPHVAKAAADEAHKLGRPVFGHSLDIFTAAANGYQSVEHSWSVVYTSIQDPKKKNDLDIGRMLGKIDTAEVHAHMEPAMFDKIIRAMVDKNVHWSTTWATWFRPLSSHAESMKKRELTLLRNPQLKYLPPYILKDTESFFAKYEKMAPDKAPGSGGRLQDAAGVRAQVRRRRRQDSLRLRSQSRRARLRAARRAGDVSRSRIDAGASDSHRGAQRRRGVGQGKRLWQRRTRQGGGSGHCRRRSVEEYFGHAKCRDGIQRRQEGRPVISRGL